MVCSLILQAYKVNIDIIKLSNFTSSASNCDCKLQESQWELFTAVLNNHASYYFADLSNTNIILRWIVFVTSRLGLKWHKQQRSKKKGVTPNAVSIRAKHFTSHPGVVFALSATSSYPTGNTHTPTHTCTQIRQRGVEESRPMAKQTNYHSPANL